ncbi:MAG: alpha/beta hydrolase [Clostridiales bacterium]|nr:alpha/beta hydrolase [Clostridiales bacterium]
MADIKIFSLVSEHDGLSLSVAQLAPDGPKALVQLAHGMAEHKERYFPLMEFLAGHGYASIINDHRGHGASVKSPDDLGYFYKDGGRGLVKDLHQVTEYFRGEYPGLPLFLLGHSMGSLAVREYASIYGRDIDGLVVSGSPGENNAVGAGLAMTTAAAAVHGSHGKSATLDKLVNGGFAKRFPEDGPFGWLSVNRENVAAYEADPLCGFPFTINGYRALLNLMRAAYDTHNTVRRNLPVHFMSGEDDPCAPDRAGFDAAVKNMETRGSAFVTSKMYPGLRHEIFNEGKPEVLEDLVKVLDGWLEK